MAAIMLTKPITTVATTDLDSIDREAKMLVPTMVVNRIVGIPIM
jgi:hypothetical protein